MKKCSIHEKYGGESMRKLGRSQLYLWGGV